jgi:hypothetical protein
MSATKHAYVVRILSSFHATIPYPYGSLSWHLVQDLIEAFGYQPLAGETIQLDRLASYNATETEFYLSAFEELIADKWIELIELNN